jgi:hypothetical protein
LGAGGGSLILLEGSQASLSRSYNKRNNESEGVRIFRVSSKYDFKIQFLRHEKTEHLPVNQIKAKWLLYVPPALKY